MIRKLIKSAHTSFAPLSSCLDNNFVLVFINLLIMGKLSFLSLSSERILKNISS